MRTDPPSLILYDILLPVLLRQLPQGSREELLRTTMKFLKLPELQSYVVDTIREAISRKEIDFVEKRGFCAQVCLTTTNDTSRADVLESVLKKLWRASPIAPHYSATFEVSEELPYNRFKRAIK